MVEPDYAFSCPHCGVELNARLDITGGSFQRFIQDCETCCRPIQITVEFEDDEISSFSAEASD